MTGAMNKVISFDPVSLLLILQCITAVHIQLSICSKASRNTQYSMLLSGNIV